MEGQPAISASDRNVPNAGSLRLSHTNAIGIEIEERYCEVAAKRLAQEVLPFDAPVVNDYLRNA